MSKCGTASTTKRAKCYDTCHEAAGDACCCLVVLLVMYLVLVFLEFSAAALSEGCYSCIVFALVFVSVRNHFGCAVLMLFLMLPIFSCFAFVDGIVPLVIVPSYHAGC